MAAITYLTPGMFDVMPLLIHVIFLIMSAHAVNHADNCTLPGAGSTVDITVWVR